MLPETVERKQLETFTLQLHPIRGIVIRDVLSGLVAEEKDSRRCNRLLNIPYIVRMFNPCSMYGVRTMMTISFCIVEG